MKYKLDQEEQEIVQKMSHFFFWCAICSYQFIMHGMSRYIVKCTMISRGSDGEGKRNFLCPPPEFLVHLPEIQWKYFTPFHFDYFLAFAAASSAAVHGGTILFILAYAIDWPRCSCI